MPSAPIPSNDAERLATLYDYSILDTLPEQIYDDITALATYICGTPVALISFVDKDRQWFKSRVGVDIDSTSRDSSFCAHTISKPQTLIVDDPQQDPRFADNPLVTADPNIRFYAGAPLVAPNGHVLGTVCVIDTKLRTLSAPQIEALEALSRQVMSLLETRLLAAEKVRAAAALLQTEKLAAVGRLASSMAHEINNPLEAVTNLLYLSRSQVKDPEIKEWLEMADHELRRVSAIANQTFRFHKQTSNPQAVTCTDLFSASLHVYESRIRNASIMVHKRKRADQPVTCFEADIRQVLGSVISNALDAMQTGGRLYVRSREGTDWSSGRKGLMLTVADTGTGMDSETQSRMFDAFFSTKGIGGAGLGLWICAEIMGRHQGRILIRSSQQPAHCGTVVTLFIPFDTASS